MMLSSGPVSAVVQREHDQWMSVEDNLRDPEQSTILDDAGLRGPCHAHRCELKQLDS